MESFGSRVRRAMREFGPLCVGVDPHPGLLAAWGLPDTPAGLASFSSTVVTALGGHVAVIKPQSAFYEKYGSAGMAILEATIRQCRETGTLVLLDVKRGDIGSTMQAYAEAYLDQARPLAVDAITATPYLGLGSLAPMFQVASANSAGAFVLALTSNSEGVDVQHARAADGRTVAQTVIDGISELNKGADPLGSFGLVIGATIGRTGHTVHEVNGPILAPGMGAQGGTPHGLKEVFGDHPGWVLPAYSRHILDAGPAVSALRSRAERARDECAAALGV